MIKVDKLKGLIVEKGFSQAQIAEKIGITPKTFYKKMKTGVFYSTEIQKMVDVLEIEEPEKIFFAKE